jgi:hypothetical protein
MRYENVRDLAVRLLRGDVVDVIDDRGRIWRGTREELSLVHPASGQVAPVLEATDAFSVAWRLATVSPDWVDVAAESGR